MALIRNDCVPYLELMNIRRFTIMQQNFVCTFFLSNFNNIFLSAVADRLLLVVCIGYRDIV